MARSSDRGEVLDRLRAEFSEHGPVWKALGGRQLWIADPELARAILSNRDGRFVDTSDFFHTRTGVFGPRRAQVEIGRAARLLIRQELQAKQADLPGLVAARWAGESDWPDAANLLVYQHLGAVLLAPGSCPELARLLERLIERAVLAGARHRYSRLSRYKFRRVVMAMVTEQIASRARDREADAPPKDLLDVLVLHASASSSAAELAELAEVYLSFVFATVGSIGFALASAVHLLGTHPEAMGCPPDWIIQESLRLQPVAWLFGRRPARPMEIAGYQLGPGDEVNVCGYLVHRHPDIWPDGDRFRPQRWADPHPDAVNLTFGQGAHSCAGSQQALSLLRDLLTVLTTQWHFTVTPLGQRQQVSAALSPPPFRLRLTRLNPAPPLKPPCSAGTYGDATQIALEERR